MNTVARLVITQDDQGIIHLEGTGAALGQKAFVYGLLEMAKDIVRGIEPSSRVQVAGVGDLPH